MKIHDILGCTLMVIGGGIEGTDITAHGHITPVNLGIAIVAIVLGRVVQG